MTFQLTLFVKETFWSKFQVHEMYKTFKTSKQKKINKSFLDFSVFWHNLLFLNKSENQLRKS